MRKIGKMVSGAAVLLMLAAGLWAVQAAPVGIRKGLALLEKRSTFSTELRKEDGASSPV